MFNNYFNISLRRNRERMFDTNKLGLFDYRRKRPNSISPQEIKAVIHHLHLRKFKMAQFKMRFYNNF